MSRFRSESRFTNPTNPAPRSIAADKWFRYSPNTVQYGNSQHGTGNMIDDGDRLRGRPMVSRHGAFKNSFRRSGPEVQEGPSNS